ncbi:Crp/Fnr family transcriptional regulator [Paenibacillus sp. J22TS3]|uniref:Crp/Fnr family transcriptional regulator n=1 Tax=Paenibacillus sp. J22TS3 TaxID=2807192 RepID=UPI001B19DB3B|nr:Crp/Fnr family transcriptional regulator [Paenibacillus sp. J22TS3]GIP23726.1 catabolite gene activator protein [Paenibacillus sp. J22TS3]
MKVIQDLEQVKAYLRDHCIEHIFNEGLVSHVSLYCFDQGEMICSQGEAFEHLYVLVKGKVKIYTTSPSGKTLILSFKIPVDVVGDIEYVQDIPMINTVEAVTPVCMIGIHRRPLYNYGKEYAPLLHFLLQIVTRKFHVKSDFLSFNLMHPVEVRLASYLLSVTSDESGTQSGGRLNTLSLTDTANLIGTSYRHLNRVIRKMSEDGLIERSKGFILVNDRERLCELAGRNIYE